MREPMRGEALLRKGFSPYSSSPPRLSAACEAVEKAARLVERPQACEIRAAPSLPLRTPDRDEQAIGVAGRPPIIPVTKPFQIYPKSMSLFLMISSSSGVYPVADGVGSLSGRCDRT